MRPEARDNPRGIAPCPVVFSATRKPQKPVQLSLNHGIDQRVNAKTSASVLPLTQRHRGQCQVAPLVMKNRPSPIKPWQRMGINRRQYSAARPWKKAGMTRAKYEKIIMAVPQEMLTEIRITAEADSLLERIFGKEFAEDLD
jgi:hypothetical protein